MLTGIQVSSLKPLLTTAEQVEQAFFRLSQWGCRIVQLQWIDKAVPPQVVGRALAANGLTAISNQDLYLEIQKDPEYYFALNQACNCRDLCVSRIPQPYRSAEGVAEYAEQLSSLYARLKAQGMTLSFHPCKPDYDKMGGQRLLDGLLARLPGDVRLCLDLYHVEHAGLSLPQTLQRYRGRVSMVHLKDYRRLPGGGEQLVPAGQGEVEWGPALDACLQTGVGCAFVEQETWERDPFDCLQEALAWLCRECRMRGE